MSEIIQIRKKAQVTLPLSVRRELGIKEGDFLNIMVRDGEIVLRAKVLVDKNQEWFWSERWQKGEAEAEEDIRKGRVHRFEDAAATVSYLRKKSAISRKTTGKRNK